MADISPRPLVNPPRRTSDLGPLPVPPPAPMPPAPAASSAPAPAPHADVVDIAPPPANDLENRIRDMLTSDAAERERPAAVSTGVGTASGPVGQGSGDGLLAARNELDVRGRDSTKMVRLMDRHRQQLERAEQDLEQMGEKLAALLPSINEAAAALKTAMRNARRSEEVQGLGDQFAKSGTALDELESISGNLGAQLLWTRSAWEQYCKTVVACQRLRGQAG